MANLEDIAHHTPEKNSPPVLRRESPCHANSMLAVRLRPLGDRGPRSGAMGWVGVLGCVGVASATRSSNLVQLNELRGKDPAPKSSVDPASTDTGEGDIVASDALL
eukprot:CAMPEP_0118967814 /NCGR_PEP_ID=MMETSP1173-20130426/5146_1 /TAXON_ID=1034831 /ORGANISM="Rhizochromulina marina cf, Strain CCMP1243" /LENGTH=105 /DNA_ID=CAMNT_0006916845 /DNA_START=338 /DNA_END=655 /DNA_ORIENTATION=+